MMLYHKEKLYVVNLTQVDIEKTYNSVLITPLKDLIKEVNTEAMSVANELTDLLRDIAKEWHPADVLADTGVGRAVETLLGIDMNCSKQPDYKGIELKSYREKRPCCQSCIIYPSSRLEEQFLKVCKGNSCKIWLYAPQQGRTNG